MSVQAAIYCRISRDRVGAGLGVDRQEADCRALAERLGWEVVVVFVDNDISAYSGKPRPQYQEMLAAVRAGRIGALVAWHTDRLHRRNAELESFIDVVEAHALLIETVKAGTVDLSTPSGRMVARMLGAAAQHEVEMTRERARGQKARAAEDGKFRGGMRPYGFEEDGVTVRESEARVLREATSAVLAGRSLMAVARELNETGEVTRNGKEWTYNRLRDVLVRPRNAGLLSKGRFDRGTGEIVGPAVWDAIVDEDTWRAVHTLLVDPSRRTHNGNDPKWLGSGVYRCGVPADEDGQVCGGMLRVAPYGATHTRKHPRRFLYRCSEQNHLTINQIPTDDYIRGVVAEMLRDPRIIAAMAPDDAHMAGDRERRAVLVARLDQTERDYDDDLIDARTRKRKADKIEAEMVEVDERLASGMRRTAASEVTGAPDPGQAFLDAPIDVQRAILATVLRVEVGPRLGRGLVWTPERLRLTPVAASA